MGTSKYSEFNASSKVIRASLSLQTTFVLKMNFNDSEWEDKAGKLIAENLRKRLYLTSLNEIVSIKDKKKLNIGQADSLRFTLLRDQRDPVVLSDPSTSDSDNVRARSFHIRISLESYQPRDCYFETVMRVR